MMAIDGWTNVLQPLSVLNEPSQTISPLDVLAVVNEINSPKYSQGNGALPNQPPATERPPYFDVNCNGAVDALDVLVLVNHLNGGSKSIGWTLDVDTQAGSGFVSSSTCSPKLQEGNSLKTQLRASIVVPNENSAVQIKFETPQFDTSSEGSIRDAFEIVVEDRNGKSIVLPYAPKLESSFNWSESLAATFGPALVTGLQLTNTVATINLTGVAAGTPLSVVVRLLNNDRDETTSVVVRGIEIVSAIGPNPSSSVWPAASTAARSPIDWSQLEDLTGNYVARYGRTTYTEDNRALFTELALENIGSTVAKGQLLAVIDNLSNLETTVLSPDGYLDDGRPYFRIESTSGAFVPGKVSASRELRFANPSGKQFSFEIKTLGVLRQGSIQFSSTPILEIPSGGQYRYNALAKGSDEALIQYRLIAGPASMTINAQSGLLQWDTQASDVGRHSVTIRASDVYGLTVDQSFSVEVRNVLVNRPPIITSTPETDAVVSSPFEVQTYATGFGPVAVDVLVHSNGTMSLVTANQGEQQLGYLAGEAKRFGATQPISIGEPNPSVLSTPFNIAYPVELGLAPNTFENNRRDIQGVITQDVNSDGNPDLIVMANLPASGNWNDDRDAGYIIVRLGNGEGTFRDGWQVKLPTVTGRIGRAASAHLKDVTGDGRLDLIVTTIATNQTLVYPGDLAKIFAPNPIVSTNTGNYVVNSQLADLNADGKMDLILFENEQVQIGGRQGISIQLGDGTGLFSGTTLIPAANNNGGYGYVADVDGINGPDLVRLNYSDTRLEVRLNNGSGIFGDVINTLTRSYFDSNNTGGRNVNPTTAYIDDFDSDGKADVLVSGPGGIILLKGQGNGQFGNGTQSGNAVIFNSNFDDPNSPGIANSDGRGKDLNGDGELDFVFGDMANAGNIMIGLGSGNGSFSLRQYNASFGDDIGQGIEKLSRTTQYIAVADFNRDGVFDLAAGASQRGEQPGSVGIFLGDLPGTLRTPNFVNDYSFTQGYSAVKARSGESVTGDFNGDGYVDIVTGGGAGFGYALFFAAGNGDGTFAPYQSALGVLADASLTALDIDRDGILDLAWFDGNRFGQAFGLGNGAFQYLPTISSQGGGQAGVSKQILQVDDFNRDGYPDLVYRLQTGNIDSNANTKIVVLLYDPANRRYRELADSTNLITTTPRAFGFYLDEALGMGDLNNDGVNEFFAFSRNNPNNGTPARFSIYEQTGSVGNDASNLFRKTIIENPSFIPSTQSIYSYLVDDFNQDGKNDIAYSSGVSTAVVMFGNGDFTFSDPTSYLSNGPLLNGGDFNGDGLTDIATTWGYGFINNSQRPFNGVFLGRSDGTFSEHYGYTTATSQTNGLFVGDFNGDGVDDLTGLGGLKHNEVFIGKTKGLTDIATGDVNGDGRPDSVTVVAGLDRVKLLHGVIDETFARQPDLFSDLFPVAVELVDADDDDLLDILTANQVGKSLSLFRHMSPATYARSDIDLPVRPTELILGDLNGDGKDDAIAISSLDQTLVGLLAGNDTFGISLILPLGFSPSGVAAGDVSGDGKLDLVLSDSEGDRLIILQGRGDGTFLTPFVIPAIHAPGAVGIADMNADGRQDIIVAHPEDDRVAILFNRGSARFTSPQYITVGDNPVAIQVRNVNNDSKPDILVPNQDENTVSVILNRFDLNQVWTYKPTATDPDGDTVTFELTSAPGGMLYDSTSNTIYWAPMPEQIGSNSVVLTASDGNGGSTDQGFAVTVTASVTVVPPIFTSTPVTTFGADSVYRYEPNVQAEDNGPKRFSIVEGPEGMTIDPTTGVVEWDNRSQGLKLYANKAAPGSPISNQNYGQIRIPDSPSLRSASITAEGWFNFQDPRGALWDQLLSKQLAASGSSTPSWGLEYFFGTLRAHVGKPGQTTSLATITAPSPIEFNKWTHIALTFDDSSKILTLYMNGKNIGSVVSPESIGYNDQPLYSGSNYITASRVKVWNTARTASEIAAQALADIPSNTPGLVVDLKFEESKDVITVLDASSSKNHGSLVGTPDIINFPSRLPALASQGTYPVTIRVEDGRGGVTEQSFTVSVKAPSISQATGTVFDDVNGNGLWDRRPDENLVFNGDFGSGAVGFTMDFIPRTNQSTFGWLGDAQSTLSNTTNVFANTSAYPAHTNGSTADLMLLANGDRQDRVAWRQAIPTVSGQSYEFSFWAIRANGHEAPRLAVRVNGQTLGTTLSLNDIGPDTWKRFVGTLQADSNTALIEIVLLGSTAVLNPGLSGAENVVGIDDLLLIPSSSRRVVVSGKANPYLAGMPNGTTAFGGTAPIASPTSVAVAEGQVLRFSATGHTFADGGVYRSRSADGSIHLSSGLVTQSALHGISQYSAPLHGSLIGVFLDDNSPAGQTPPAALDFRATGNVPGGVNYTSLQPVLRQVFFIGDGRNADGVEQTITVPLGATRLFLANSSRNGWDSQNGEFEVQIFDSASEPVQANRHVFVDSNFNGRLDPVEPSTLTNSYGVYALPIPGTVAQIGLAGKEGELQIAPGIPFNTFDLNTDVFPINFGSRDIAVTEAPRFTTPPVTIAIAPGSYRYQSFAQSPNGKPMTYALAVGPQGMSIDPSSGLVRWNPIASNRGNNDVILRATDADGKVALQRYTIDVEVNTIPVVTSTPPARALQSVPLEYRVLAQDAEQATLHYSLITAPAGMGIDATTGLIQWLPSSLTTDSVSVKIDDQRGGFVEHTFSIAVQPVGTNRAPEFTSGPRAKAILGREFASRIGASDEDNDVLSYTLVSGPSGLTISAQGEVFWQPSTIGSFDFLARVSDSRGGTDEQSYTLSVVSRAPAPDLQISSSPSTAAVVGNLFAYDVIANHGELFELVTSPSGMSIAPSRVTIRWVPTKDQLGVQSVKIRVTDVLGNMAEQSFVIAVRSSSLVPTISSAPLTEGAVGQTYVYAVSVANPSRSPLTYSLNVAPAGMQIDAALGVITWTPNPNQIGPIVVSIQVRDSLGSFSTQTFSIVVSAGAVNRPPITATTPSMDAVVGTPYAYTMVANDPEGGAVSYAVRSAPTGFAIHPTTGVVTWTPVAEDIGTVPIVLTATDPQGGVAVQSIQIDVRAANRLPTIHSNPNLKVSQGALYRYDVLATDPDREPLFYSLVTAPPGMTIDAFGRIRWQTQLDTPLGGREVVVRVVDGLGGVATQSFTFGVVPDTLAPRITIIVGGEPVLYPWTSAPAIVRVIAADDVGLTGVELRVDGKPVELAADGTARVYFSAPGNGRLEAIATDAAGNRGTALARVSMRSGEEDGGGNPAPEATITNITDGVAVGGSVDVIGTAVSPDFERYVLSYRRIDQSSYKTILTSTTQVTTGTLGKWDTTLLENDNYLLKLEVYDTFGSFAAVEVEVSVSSNLKLGNFRLSFEDMTIPVAGIPITIARTYDTLRVDRDGDFGYGWRLEYRNTDLRTSLPKSGLEDIGIYTPFKPGTKVFLTLPGGKREGFTFTPDIKVLPGFGRNNNLVLASPRFTPDRGVTSTLSAGSGQLTVNEFGELFASGGIPWNPASPDFGGGYTLTTREGIQYRIDGETGLMTSAVDRNGNVLSFSNDGVTSQSENIRVAMERDSQGRIRSITDPLGKMTSYTYSALGDLTSITDREGNLTKLSYRSDQAHYLDTIVDPLGGTGIRNEYDASGRLIGIINADGKTIQTTYDPANQIETIVDPLGNRTINEYDSQGNVVRATNAIGAVTSTEYDANNFPTKTIDPLGRVTTMVNDAFGFKIAETDPRGSTTRWTYGRFGDETSKTDALGNVTRTGYDANGNLIGRTDANGRSGSIQYSTKGLVQSLVAIDGISMTVTNDRGKPDTFTTEGQRPIDIEYDAAGRPVAMRFQGNASNPETEVVVRLELDANGKLIRETDGEGGVTQSFYDDAGNRIRMIDPLGRITRYEYDFANRLVKTIFPDSTEESQSFDAAGRRISMTDRLGRITRYEFDAVGRETAILYPDGTPNDLTDNPRIQTEYDLAGQIIKRINELGHATNYQYDAAGNQVAMANALNETWSMQYDANNRRIVDRDPLGNTTRTVYDGVGNVVQQFLPDGSQFLAEYDGRGRITSRVDGEGGKTMFRYDAYGALVEVVDPLGNRTRYERNERGQATAIIDAEGRTTEFQFDKANRQIARTLPDGAIERSFYDAAGQMTSMIDFMWRTTTYTYDINGRLVRQQFSDGRINETQYNAIGQVVSSREGTTTTTYGFDERNRLTSKTDPDGLSIQYVYDVASNLISTTSIAGATVYSYDSVDRLQSVTAGSEVTRYVYDTAGRHTEIQYSNGTIERREYDPNSRVTRQTLTGPSGTLDDTRTAYDRVGRKTSLVEATGRKESFEYDLAGRLIRNTVDELSGPDRNTTWQYDAVGNRLRRDDSISGVTTYEYDNRDRLLIETNALTTRYLYDANGNILSQFDGVKRIENTWDAANRLMESKVTEGTAVKTVRYTYSPDGERYERIEDGETTRFLVDSNREHAVVIAELVNGVVRIRFVRPPAGEAAIAMIRDGQTSTIYTTPMGTTKLVTDASANITDSFVVDPFGVVVARTGTTVGLPIYNGEFRDAITGYDYLRARFYSPQMGRFVSMDTFPGWKDVPISLNKYLYANSDPVNGRDPSGLFTLTDLQAVFSINTLVFSAAGGIAGYHLGGFKGALLGALLGGLTGAVAVARTYQFVTAAAGSAEISFLSSQFLVPLFVLDTGIVSLGALSFLGASVLGTGLDAKATIDARLDAAGGTSGANLPFSSLRYDKK